MTALRRAIATAALVVIAVFTICVVLPLIAMFAWLADDADLQDAFKKKQ